MPFCRRDRDDTEAHVKPEDEMLEAEWREPPGRLGEYVRRVKRMTAMAHRPAAAR